jgi:FkbM family methyltransferase
MMESGILQFSRTVAGWFFTVLPQTIRNGLAVHLGKPDLRFSLMQLRRFGFFPHHVLDIGAYRGEWARVVLEVWPETSVLCVEPQQAPQKELRQFARQNASRITIKQGLLGTSNCDAVQFAEVGTGSSVLASQLGASTRPMWRIDTLVDEGLAPPDFVKLDVQGYELGVLAGFEKNLRHCHLLQLELSLLPIVPGGALLHEVVAYLKERGFVMFDVDELIRAPSDGAVWQIDALFCREDSLLRQDRTWR